MRTAKNKTLEPAAYAEAEAWDTRTRAMLDAQRDLNYSTLLRGDFAVEEDDITAQIEHARQLRDDYAEGVEKLTVAILLYESAHDAGYAKQYEAVSNEEWDERMAEKAGA
jgi:hypothetical protein